MHERSRFPVERFDEIMKRPQDFRLLERIPLTEPGALDRLPIKLHEPEPGETIKQIVFLDTETTGMDAGSDRIIELGLLRCSFSFERRVLLTIDKCYDQLSDPGRKIPPEIVQFTGITDEMVRGKHFDKDLIAQMLAGTPLIAAHNAKFDRPFIDRSFPLFSDLAWCCTMSGINWEALGSSGRKLEYLTLERGWFYASHRASNDCLAMAWLMHLEPEAFAMLIDSALLRQFRLYAWKAPFSIKDDLKARGYRFDGSNKVWYKDFLQEGEAAAAKQQLSALYDSRSSSIVKLDAKTRFKASGPLKNKPKSK